jgi:hypothetical protein
VHSFVNSFLNSCTQWLCRVQGVDTHRRRCVLSIVWNTMPREVKPLYRPYFMTSLQYTTHDTSSTHT